MDGSAESSSNEKAPLWITPLFQRDENGGDEGYRTLKRLISRTPNPSCVDSPYGEVEACLEEYLGPDGDALWRRVAVRGCTGSDYVLHASFALPPSDDNLFDTSFSFGNEDHIMCWASFPERPDHKLLCVLASPLLLCIWDVYPSNKDGTMEPIGGGEGNCVTLPFEARGIFPLAEQHGLLLQRKNTVEDRLVNESLKRSFRMARADLDEEYAGGFVLQEPPKPVRLGNVLTSPSGMEMTIAPPSPQVSVKGGSIPSLFSLKHPLDEILPVTRLEGDSSHAFFADVREEILFVGTPRWTDREDGPYEKTEYSQPICVTYHTELKRHALWSINSAPLPPPTPPLWQVSRDQREEHGLGDEMSVMHDPHVVSEGNLGRFGLADPDTSWHGTTSRYEALADALGVSSARKSEDHGNRVRGGGRSRRSGGLKVPPTSMLSPLPVTREPVTHSVRNAPNERSQAHVDFSGVAPDDATKVESRVFSPFADLSAEFTLTLLYEEEPTPNNPLRPAADIFLASNFDASGTLILCLVCPSKTDANPFDLRCLSLSATRLNRPPTSAVLNQRHTLSVDALAAIPCISAQPIQAAPVPLCFLPSSGASRKSIAMDKLATDIMVLSRGGKRNSMVLCRSGIILANCVLPRKPSNDFSASCSEGLVADVVGIKHPVVDCMDYICSSSTGEGRTIRGRLRLHFPSSPACDSALAALDAAFFIRDEPESSTKEGAVQTALNIRIDCVKLAQEVSSMHDSQYLQNEDAAWSAVECVLSLFIESHLFRRARGTFPTKSLEESKTNDWSLLLDSEYGSSYNAEHGSLFLGIDEVEQTCSSQDNLLSMTETLMSKIQPTWIQASGDPLITMPATLLASTLFDSLHLLYEESKLSRISSSKTSSRLVGSLLASLCFRVIRASGESNTATSRNSCMGDFLDHYRRDLGTKWLRGIEQSIKVSDNIESSSLNFQNRRMLTSFPRPPCFFEWLDSKMKRLMHRECTVESTNFYDLRESSEISPAFRRTRGLHRAFSALHREDGISVEPSERDKLVVKILVEEGMTSAAELRDELPAGFALPLLDVLHRCRGDPNVCSTTTFSADAWSLLGRTDLSKQCNTQLPCFGSSEVSAANKARYHDLLADDDKDGIVPLEVTSSMLFPDDNRIHEVGKFLRSSRPLYLHVKRSVEVSDHDYERLKQERLLVLCRRTLAVPLGRGMLTFGNLRPIPAEPLPVPKLCLSGRVPPTNATLALDVSSCPADMNVWPEFHNGVAAGLRLPYDENGIAGTVHQITRTWIVYNRRNNAASPRQNPGSQTNNESPDNSSQANHAHGGVLMALGLRGHLATLSMTDIYDYLTQGAVTTTVGILIGMSANRRGSCDPAVSKMLCLHIPSLLPASFTALDVAGPAQAAAVAGIGLLYQGSSHRLMTEFLLEELGKRPTSDSISIDREAYTLSCGLALGMVNLAKGEKSFNTGDGSGWSGLADLDLDERLQRFVLGGIDETEQRRRQEAADRLSNATGVPVSESERSSCLYEGDMVNTDITAPGATLALGLMYMKSGNNSIASSLALPDTHFLLEYVRPDLLLLRVIARSLILWDQVQPSDDWIDVQIPAVVKAAYNRMREAVKNAGDFSSKEPDSATAEASTSPPIDEAVDRQAVRQIYVHAVAGACFGMGLRFAGTGDKRASAAIFKKVVELRTLREGTDPVSAALRPEVPVLEMCLGCAVISLAMVMAGTGDLDTLFLLKLIRWRCGDDTRYGDHMAYGAAIGLLFLGGGSCTLGRSPEDIAALLLAFFPRFPSTTSDNQHHLQALRHCYTLAVKHREIRAIDSDTGESVFVPIEIDFTEESAEILQMTTPCLLMNTIGSPNSLRVASDRYYPLSLDIRDLKSGLTFYVKKRSGHLSHSQDPHSQRSLLVQTGIGAQSVRDLIESFSEDPMIVSYAQYLCDVEPEGPLNGKERCLSWVSGFCAHVLHECLTKDTEEALPLYLKLRSSVESMRDGHPASIEAYWDIRLIQTYYQVYDNLVGGMKGRLLSAEFVAMLSEMVERALSSTSLNENDVLVYMKSGERRTAFKDDPQGLLGPFLVWYDVPFPRGAADGNIDDADL